MLDKNKHRIILVGILKELYAHPQLRNVLGFKGGTAAFLFYALPRLSVDLDFDLLDPKKKSLVFETVKNIVKKFAVRDIFDLWFYFHNKWDINESLVSKEISQDFQICLKKAIKKVQSIKKNQLLQGLGELLDEKQKNWVKNNLQKDLLFELKLRLT